MNQNMEENTYYYYDYEYLDDVVEDEDKKVKASSSPSNSGSESKEKDRFYYYYYYQDGDKSKEPNSKDDNSPTVILPELSSGGTTNKDEKEYYYYYYDKVDESLETLPKTSSEEKFDNPTISNDIITDRPNLSPDSSGKEVPSSLPNSKDAVDEEEYYYYYIEESEVEDEEKDEIGKSDKTGNPNNNDSFHDSSLQQSSKVTTTPTSSPTSSPTKDKKDKFYYYYKDEESPQNSSEIQENDDIISTQPPFEKIGIGNVCHDYLFSSSFEGVKTIEVPFTFMLETKHKLYDLNDIATRIVDNVSPSMLQCANNQKQKVFLIHFPSKDPIQKVNDCIPVTDELNDCMIIKGHLLLGSNQNFTPSDDIYSAVEEAVNKMDNLSGDIAFVKYLGPAHELQNVQHVVGDQVVVAMSVLLSIPLIFLMYRFYRKASGYRRVTFAD